MLCESKPCEFQSLGFEITPRICANTTEGNWQKGRKFGFGFPTILEAGLFGVWIVVVRIESNGGTLSSQNRIEIAHVAEAGGIGGDLAFFLVLFEERWAKQLIFTFLYGIMGCHFIRI